MTVLRSKKRWGLLAAGGILAGAASAVWVRRQYVAITVEGMSMSPALYNGEKVLIRRGIRGLQPGRIVVLSRPDPVSGWRHNPPAGRDLDATSWYIKRVVAVGGQPYPENLPYTGLVPSGHVVVVGDHPFSEDSKQHGPCPIDQILGIQVRKLSVTSSAGSVFSITPRDWPDDIDALTFNPGDLTEGVGAVATGGEGVEDPRQATVEAVETPEVEPEPTPDGQSEAVSKSKKKAAKKAAKKPASGEAERDTKKKSAKKATKKAAKRSTKKSTDQ